MSPNSSVDEKFLQVFREVFQNPNLKVTDESTPKDVSGWDSLRHVNLIVALEETFELSFTTDEIASLQQVGDIKKVIRSRVGV